MIELELLGLTDGQQLSLNDSEGNRYVLPITDELRAALRTDISSDDAEPKPITPREIQAHFRAGLSIAEVSEISSLPPSQLKGLAFPIFAEREYTAQLARSYRLGQDVGGMTLEELVTSRLVARQVDATAVTWDAYRDKGEMWTLAARYPSEGREHTALWNVDTKAQTLHARNDEAKRLTESQIPADPWRAPASSVAPTSESVAGAGEARGDSATKEESTQPSADKISALDAQPVSTSNPVDIDSMLASLNSKRGTSQPMPDDADEPEFAGAHPAHSEPEAATDATVLELPSNEGEPASDQQEIPGVVDKETLENAQQEKGKAKKKKGRRDRPAMPSWDEIVFGYSKDR
ncbi:septation protein SepH [Trueperella bialowiezensis]|uniref:Protein of uncharacterized function (DUF3071) n=1 Tax=Trueperella bialowiezensis TaxID=312285 RepID=A0A448PC25_9ACTO|nr:septation protein SepH [Trueperella bialowiezensis]VEI12511.1 Protein of uncharacterised function (DUF3071) [Trueperella bialowiezensis]